MAITITPQTDNSVDAQLLKGGIKRTLELQGRLPPVTIVVTPIDGTAPFSIARFLNYSFNSSVLIPVDNFSFTFVAPGDAAFYGKTSNTVKEGDIVTLLANNVPLSTGIVDSVEIETDEGGEKITLNGRDLMGQLEDQDSVSILADPLYGQNTSITGALGSLIRDTRVQGINLKQTPNQSGLLFATEPGESKLSSLQRFLDGINCLAWMDPTGRMNVGRPNMSQPPLSRLFMLKAQQDCNVTSMKVSRSSATIPNIFLPVWSGQEIVQFRVGKSQALENKATGPDRLRRLGHVFPKCVVVSTPTATNAQALDDINKFKAAAGNQLQAYAKREMAKQNHKEMIVQCVVPGHYNDSGLPYQVDQVYNVQYDRGSVDEDLYLYQVEYTGGEDSGQKTLCMFCKLGTIVADIKAVQ